MREKIIKSVNKLGFGHKEVERLPQVEESGDIALLNLFDIDEERFEKEYELVFFENEKKHIQDYFFQHELYFLENRKDNKKTVLCLNIEQVNLNELLLLLEFDEIRLASQKTKNIFLKNQNSIGKEINKKVGAEPFIHELFEKARLTQVTDIYIRLLGLDLIIEYLKSTGKEVIATLGISESVLIRNVLANMSRKEAKDMRYSAQIYIGKHEYRIQFFETAQGYDATIRVYGSADFGDALNLKVLDYLEVEEKEIRRIFGYQYGLVLMVAQMGQGKTTTQYANMEEMAIKGLVVRSIENPVEKRLKRVSQIDLSRYASAEGKFLYTAIEAVTDVLRARAQVLNMGEIRTVEDMKVAYAAASTGCLVLGTLHANNVFFAIDRLLKEAGLSIDDLKAVLRGIIYQYLSRKLCPHCKELIEGTEYRRHKEGCSKCNRGFTFLRTPMTEIAHFKFRGNYDLFKPETYEFYRSFEESVLAKYDLGYIDAFQRDILLKGLREPEIDELDDLEELHNGNR